MQHSSIIDIHLHRVGGVVLGSYPGVGITISIIRIMHTDFNMWINQPYNQSSNKSSYQSINQSINQSGNHSSIDMSVIQS